MTTPSSTKFETPDGTRYATVVDGAHVIGDLPPTDEGVEALRDLIAVASNRLNQLQCAKCGDTGEIKKPVSDYIRELDVKAGHADRPLYSIVSCGCRIGRARERASADQRFD